MVVWVLIITLTGSPDGSYGPNYKSGAAVTVIDNIATDDSCQQLARVVRQQSGVTQATCAPVRKIVAPAR